MAVWKGHEIQIYIFKIQYMYIAMYISFYNTYNLQTFDPNMFRLTHIKIPA